MKKVIIEIHLIKAQFILKYQSSYFNQLQLTFVLLIIII